MHRSGRLPVLMRDDKRGRVAIEEAAHLVAGWWLGLGIGDLGATIKPTLLWRGAAWAGRDVSADVLVATIYRQAAGQPVPECSRGLLEAEAVMTLAGPLAAERAFRLGLVCATETLWQREWEAVVGSTDAEQVEAIVYALTRTPDEAAACRLTADRSRGGARRA